MDRNSSRSAFQMPKVGEVWIYQTDRTTDRVVVTRIIDPGTYNTQVEYLINGALLRATIKEFNRWYNPPEVTVQQEQPKRIPKPGEVWFNKHESFEVVNVWPDAVTYKYPSSRLMATTLDTFLDCFTPPEPTVIMSRWLFQNIASLEQMNFCTHRLDYMSDGEYRLVKL